MFSFVGCNVKVFVFLLLLCCTGCEVQPNLPPELQSVDWKVWAAIAVALFVSPGKILGTVTEQLKRIPFGEQAMRMLGLIRSADTSPGELTAPEAAEAMMSIALKMPPGPLRDQIVAVISAAMKSDTPSGK